MVIIASATDELRAIYDQAGSSSADARDYEPGQEPISITMRINQRLQATLCKRPPEGEPPARMASWNSAASTCAGG